MARRAPATQRHERSGPMGIPPLGLSGWRGLRSPGWRLMAYNLGLRHAMAAVRSAPGGAYPLELPRRASFGG